MFSLRTLCFLLLLLFLSNSELSAQTNFPKDWLGKWQGTLEIFRDTGRVQTLPMEFHVLPLDTVGHYTWTIIYGKDQEKGKRAYELITIDAAKGKYLIDEKNSIKLEAYLLGEKLMQVFEVGGTYLTCSQHLQGETMIFEIFAGKSEAISKTGGESKDIPIVSAYPVSTRQVAVLKRVE